MLKIALLLAAIGCCAATREHKVHNIVLYPERHSWCQTQAIKQIVASPGYEPTTIDNNVCVGACYSYSIPSTQPAEPGELIGPYCDSCQPIETRCYHVTLHADGKNLKGPSTIQKRVQIITNCTCLSCDKVPDKDCDISDQNTSELPSDIFTILHPNGTNSSMEIPELLHLIPPINRTVDLKLDNLTAEHNVKLLKFLETLQNDEKDTPIDQNLMDIVNLTNVDADIQIDFSKLKEALVASQNRQNMMEKHRNFGLGAANSINLLEVGEKNNADINRDVGGLPKGFGVEANMGHYKGSLLEQKLKIHDHHVGEEQRIGLDVGKLIRGPHGSLVLMPEEKLNLESHIVKPNNEGSVIAYENHPKKRHV